MKRWIVLAALAPGWIIPRIVVTLAFMAAPSWSGLVALLSWWLLMPLLWIVGLRLWRRFRRSSNSVSSAR